MKEKLAEVRRVLEARIEFRSRRGKDEYGYTTLRCVGCGNVEIDDARGIDEDAGVCRVCGRDNPLPPKMELSDEDFLGIVAAAETSLA